MAGSKFDSAKNVKKIQSELLIKLIPSDNLRNDFLSGKDTIGINGIVSHLEKKASKETGLAKIDGSANKLYQASEKIQSILIAFHDLNDKQLEDNKKVEAFKTMSKNLRAMFEDPASPDYLPKLLNSYLTEYGGKALSSSQMSKLATLSQSLFHAYQKLNSEDLSESFEACDDDLERSEMLKGQIKKLDDSCTEKALELSIDLGDIGGGVQKKFEENEKLQLEVSGLIDEEKIKKQLEEADKNAKNAVEKLAEGQRINALEADKHRNELVLAEKEIESSDKFFAEYQRNRKALLERIETHKANVEKHEKILATRAQALKKVEHYKGVLQKLKEQPEYTQKVNYLSNLKERFDTYQRASQDLKDQALVDFEELNDSLKEYHKTKQMPDSPSAAKILQDYLKLKEELICAISTDEKKRSVLRKEFETVFEAKQGPKPALAAGKDKKKQLFYAMVNTENTKIKTPIDLFLEKYDKALTKKFQELIEKAGKDKVITEFEDIKKILNDSKKSANTGWNSEREIEFEKRSLESAMECLNIENSSYKNSVKKICAYINLNLTPDMLNIESWDRLKKSVSDYRKKFDEEFKDIHDVDINALQKDALDKMDIKENLQKTIRNQKEEVEKRINTIQETSVKLTVLKNNHSQLLNLKAQKKSTDLGILQRNQNIHNRAYPIMALNALNSFSVMLNPGTDPKNNSVEFNEMQEKLRNAKSAMENKATDHMAQMAAITALKTSAEKYLNAKNAQWFRFWPFTSDQRYLRMKGAANLIDFCKETKEYILASNSSQMETIDKLNKLKEANEQDINIIEKKAEMLHEKTTYHSSNENSLDQMEPGKRTEIPSSGENSQNNSKHTTENEEETLEI